MPVISIEIMKTIDERELQKTIKRKTYKDRRKEGSKEKRSYNERVRSK